MIEAQADIALGEAIGPSALAHSKVFKGGLALILVPALVFAGAIIASSLIGMVLPRISLRLEGFVSLLWIAGALLGLTAALRILAKRQLVGYLNGLRRLGSPETFPPGFASTIVKSPSTAVGTATGCRGARCCSWFRRPSIGWCRSIR